MATEIKQGIMLQSQTENVTRLCQQGFIGFANKYKQQVLNPAIYANVSIDERISECITAQEEYVHNRTCERIIKNAGFESTMTLNEIAKDPSDGLSRKDLQDLTGTVWIERGMNIAITGGCGIGKTSLACAIGIQAAVNGVSVYYARTSTLLAWLSSKSDFSSKERALKRIARYKVLILDDFGTDGSFSEDDLKNMARITNERYRTKPIVIGSQYRVEGFYDLFPKCVGTEGVVDRLINPCHEIALTGESRRAGFDNSLS